MQTEYCHLSVCWRRNKQKLSICKQTRRTKLTKRTKWTKQTKWTCPLMEKTMVGTKITVFEHKQLTRNSIQYFFASTLYFTCFFHLFSALFKTSWTVLKSTKNEWDFFSGFRIQTRVSIGRYGTVIVEWSVKEWGAVKKQEPGAGTDIVDWWVRNQGLVPILLHNRFKNKSRLWHCRFVDFWLSVPSVDNEGVDESCC